MDPAETTRLSFVERLRSTRANGTWSEFHDCYGELLYSYARRLGATHDDAEDAVQDVELSLFRALGGFRHFERKGCFRAYLRTSVAHALGRRNGKRGAHVSLVDPREFEERMGAQAGADPEWERAEYLDRIRTTLRLMASDFQPATLDAFELHVLGGTPVEETARRLGISKDSVYQAKSRVLKQLKERLAVRDDSIG